MVTIPINAVGDHWVNSDAFLQQLYKVPKNECIELDLKAEGPSLGRLGILEVLDRFCKFQGRSSETIGIKSWANRVEPVPYKLLDLHHISHFFMFSERYRPLEPIASCHENLFGFFIGRKTFARSAMMYEIYHRWPEKFLLSVLKDTRNRPPWWRSYPGRNLESQDDWIKQDDAERFAAWWKTDPIPSLDRHILVDQYDLGMNTNRDLLAHYHRFDIELVAETFTLGTTFFPTEKTVRPLAAGKPFILYGPKNFLANLRNLGFHTFGDLWDESYDNLEGVERWNIIKSVIAYISEMPMSELKRLMSRADQIAIDNRRALQELIDRHR